MQGSFVALLILLGGYVVADGLDVVPGIFTFKDEPESPQSYPTPRPLAAESATIPAGVDAPAFDAAVVEQAVNTFLNDDRNTGESSIKVTDALSGEVVYQMNESTARIPASNMKVVTAAAALTELGPNTTLETMTVLSGDQLYIVGGGDVYLAAGEGDPDAIVGHAGLADLAEQTAQTLATLGVDTVSVAVDSSLFSDELYHSTVEGADRGYVMALRPLAIDRGRSDAGYDPHPDVTAAATFSEALAEHGITVVGDVTRGTAPEATPDNTMGIVYSAPVRELVDQMLTVSDNSMAEVLAHLVGISRGRTGSFADASTGVYEVLAEAGYDMSGVRIADSSGLSMDNRITVTLVNSILSDALCQDCALSALPSGMPTASLSGTLSSRFLQTGAEGLVHAKTGTLVEANSLSGYAVSAAGRPFIFTILTDHIEPGTTGIIRPALDDLVAGMGGW